MFRKLALFILSRKVDRMLGKFLDKIQGYKTHAVQVTAVVVALASYIWGPLDAGGIHMPKIDFKELLEILQVGGGLSFLRIAVKKMEEPKL